MVLILRSIFPMESTRPDADAELNYALRLVGQACQVLTSNFFPTKQNAEPVTK
jgi:hypothetical protein